MLRDIPQPKVKDVAIAIVPRLEQEEELWDTYLINLRETTLSSVLVNSRGYGNLNGEQIRTTSLRHFYDNISPYEVIQIEPIQTKLFSITNEYWLSFNLDGHMYDKKYVFVHGAIDRINFTRIPLIEKSGVMIK